MAYTDVGIPMSPGTLTHQDLRFQLLQAEPCSAILALDAISPLNFSIHLRKRIFKEINIYSNLKICVYLTTFQKLEFIPAVMDISAERAYPTPIANSPLLPLLLLSLAKQRNSPIQSSSFKEEYDYIVGKL
ncbi:hypothetical protein AVEN_30159-1 [Araneus ventricosus]|uniref:Uncharacterized protein n=1 Tax=Araneus ventricosus TaxID=182803 RepID=A0A4Y2TM60_ARAVE|nr:hypothetical protein AVEN_224086-1 [Araneus ventricosus]GBO01725.1 hypothetical protein AVEN_30159-1 [Araneus ventricosus]